MHRWNEHHSRRRRGILIPLAILAAMTVCAGIASAGSVGRKGTAGATELLIPIGPRGNALGGTVAADVTGLESVFWNPAGLGSTTTTEANFSHTEWFADMKVNFAGVAAKAGGLGTIAFAAKVLSIGDILVATEQAPDGTGETLTPTFAVMGITWAKQFTDRVNFGVTTNYVAESVADNNARGVAFDFGVQYNTGFKGIKLGLAMKNVGTTMSYSGPGFDILTHDPSADPNAGNRVVSFSSASFNMPSYFALSSTVDLLRSSDMSLIALGMFENNNYTGDNISGGLEWEFKDTFALRGSYFGTFNGTIDPSDGSESFKLNAGDDLFTGVAVGAGAKTRLGDAGKIGVDVAWRPVRSEFNDIVEVGLKLDF